MALCLCAGCQSEIAIPAYAQNVARSNMPQPTIRAREEPPPPPPAPPSDDALPRAAVLDNLPSAPATPPPSGQGTSTQGTSTQGTSGQDASAQATAGQATSGQAASGGPDRSAPVVLSNDRRLVPKSCPTVAKPPYTDEARKAKAEGLITAKCTVETDGSLTCAATWSTAPLLTQPVLDYLAKQKVQPFTLTDGTKVRVECSYSYRYKP